MKTLNWQISKGDLTEADLLPMMDVTMAPPWAMAREDIAAPLTRCYQ